ncbi:m20/m25/m40 family metallo-hydrolase [Anaeramoeba ignava]|uniref:M20/m25/m40 family metallo-hydrolase n=1 Tax=Anaeramoeba ignava TaxID=1746090 RepID=A0A9Q0REG5_ANAIG|nr:m20/m25/m40 family metallo-hydrolase [Anaeramoeba ignava]
MEELEKNLRELIQIYAPSKEEKPVAEYLLNKLNGKLDDCFIDDINNFIGISRGEEAKALLIIDAHIDNCKGVKTKKKNIKEKETEILHGSYFDNRGAVAIMMQIAQTFKPQNIQIVFAGTAQEETTSNGAKAISENFGFLPFEEKYCIVIDADDSTVINKGPVLLKPNPSRPSRNRLINLFENVISKEYQEGTYQISKNEQHIDFSLTNSQKYQDSYQTYLLSFAVTGMQQKHSTVSIKDLYETYLMTMRSLEFLDQSRFQIDPFRIIPCKPIPDVCPVLNTDLLIKLLKIPSPSTLEKRFRDFITLDLLTPNQIPFEQDSFGNICWLNEPEQPVLCAHIDTVQKMEDVIYADTVRLNGNIIQGDRIIGADDKCGVFIILDLLINKKMKFNWILTCQEELGLVGATEFMKSPLSSNLDFLPYALILDDVPDFSPVIRCYEIGYGSKALESFLLNIAKPLGYLSWFSFSRTDGHIFSSRIMCASVSIGAYNIHSHNEYVDVFALHKGLKFVQKCLESKFIDK